MERIGISLLLALVIAITAIGQSGISGAESRILRQNLEISRGNQKEKEDRIKRAIKPKLTTPIWTTKLVNKVSSKFKRETNDDIPSEESLGLFALGDKVSYFKENTEKIFQFQIDWQYLDETLIVTRAASAEMQLALKVA